MTKLKGDIAEQAFVLAALKRSYRVLLPVGDRLPYDIAIDLDGQFVRVQVKSAWLCGGRWIVDNRRTKTNRHVMLREVYSADDFDIAAIYVADLDVFYLMPVETFTSFGSTITLGTEDGQRAGRAEPWRENWHLLASYTSPSGSEQESGSAS